MLSAGRLLQAQTRGGAPETDQESSQIMKRVALITGGTRGIGLGIAQALAREGFNLAVCGLRDESAAAEPLKALRSMGTDVLYCQCDVARREARDEMLAAIRLRFGRLAVLVNNAGIAPQERRDILE